jgi:predicted glutamine amidotransferase
MQKKIKNNYIIDNNMCRLFLSIKSKNILNKLYSFLSQSVHLQKYTPLLNNYRDGTVHKDGFGLAWYKNKQIEYYKSPLLYTEDSNINNVISNLKSNIIFGHVRQKTESNTCYDNTHPFYYNNQIFMHNGKIKDFNQNKEIIFKYINPKYLILIKGYTDSEVLFYLFLTINDNLLNPKLAMKIIFKLFKKLDIELTANIIYANENIILVTRYLVYNQNNYKEKQIPPSLYIDYSDGIIISSEPLSNNWELIKENTIFIIDIKNSNLL